MKSKNICNWYNVCSMKRYFEEGKLEISGLMVIVKEITIAV